MDNADANLWLTYYSGRTKMRDYTVKQIDVEGEPEIARGKSNFYSDDIELVPDGYRLNFVENAPNLKTIYVEVTR